MKFRNVTLLAFPLLASAALLVGCDAFKEGNYELQKQFGLYPVDPPRAETPMPPPGSIAQADWAAQRSLTLRASNQSYTAPVGYKELEQLAAQQQTEQPQTGQQAGAAQPAAVSRTASAPAARAAAPTVSPRPAQPAPAMPVPAAATSNPAAITPAAPVVAALPAGYTPSPSVVDRPADAAEQQRLAAATGAVPEPPAMAGSMTVNTSAASAPGWKAHLASHRTEGAAINEWQELLKSNAALYGQFDPLVEWTDTQRGAFARLVLVGFADRKAADDACAKIRSSTRYCASIQ